MLYVSEPDGHKFSVGEKLRLVDLETVPEYNGDIVEIVAIRADDYYGKHIMSREVLMKYSIGFMNIV